MAAPDPRQCRPGDVMLFYGLNVVSAGLKAAKALKILTVVPAVVSAARTGTAGLAGSASCNHAAIISRIQMNDLGRAVAFDMSHATDARGIVTCDIDNFFLGHTGGVKIFRCKYQGAGADAAAVALRWAPDNGGQGNLPFSRGKAFCSAFRSSSYGSGAKARAALFRQHRNTAGGPPNLRTGLGEMSMFCSMFVIACYQAALGDDAATSQVIGLDAKFTSPMTLDGYLDSRSQLWEEVNALPPPA